MIQITCNRCGGFAALKKTCTDCNGLGYREVRGRVETVKTTSGEVRKSKKQVIKSSEYIPDGIVKTEIWDTQTDGIDKTKDS